MLENYWLPSWKTPATLLCRFYGLLEIESVPFKGILIVMNNVSHSNIIRDKAPAMLKYDLKGSSRGRVVKEEAVLKGRCFYCSRVLCSTYSLEHPTGTTAKDLNWTNAKRKIRLGTKMGNLLLDQLERDAKLLMENEILDYSLLLGVIRSDDAAVHASQWNKKSDDDDDDVDRRLRSRWSLYHGGICLSLIHI